MQNSTVWGLVSADSESVSSEVADTLVLGSGIAGLCAAWRASAKDKRVLVLEKNVASSSKLAQGGIAASIGKNDSWEKHYQDTMAAGDGLCDPTAVKFLCKKGRERILELADMGAPFEKDSSGNLGAGLEAAHSEHRIVHARDRTGREVTGFLTGVCFENRVEFKKGSLVDLLCEDKNCFGALVQTHGGLRAVFASSVVVATGGYAGIYKGATAPTGNTGDGIAACWRAGARLADLEFIQFHPTGLAGTGFLISEALRGAGAVVVNQKGERILSKVPGNELAPRHIVAREIGNRLNKGERVFLDATSLGKNLKNSFPGVYAGCLKHGFDITKQPVPIEPVAHYAMGGVLSGMNGETDLKNAFCVGEAACTFSHGANRLASNSLLESLVCGQEAGLLARNADESKKCAFSIKAWAFGAAPRETLASIALHSCGLIRNKQILEGGLSELSAEEKPLDSIEHISEANATCLLRHAMQSALERRESRGSHFRSDYPEKNSAWEKHSIINGLSGKSKRS